MFRRGRSPGVCAGSAEDVFDHLDLSGRSPACDAPTLRRAACRRGRSDRGRVGSGGLPL